MRAEATMRELISSVVTAAVAVAAVLTVPVDAAHGQASIGISRAQVKSRCAGAPHGWLHTKGVWIVDSKGCRVRLAGVTWFGMETTHYVPAGLNFQTYQNILAEIKALGFNSIRIPLTDELVRYNNVLTVDKKFLKKNRDLWGLHPLQLLDRIVAAAGKLHLMIILDNHYSTARPRSFYADNKAAEYARENIEPLWTTKGYSEATWINDWVDLAYRYRYDPTVIGMDLRNEPHTSGPGPWSIKTYLKQGATWGRYPSKMWKRKSDWKAAAQKCGNAIQRVNPNLLLFVEGIELYPDSNRKSGVVQYWWGGNLRGAAVDPIHFSLGEHLVYSPHEYGPWKGNPGDFNSKTSYASLAGAFEKNWAFILNSKNPKIRAPIWLGEFDTCNFPHGVVIPWESSKKQSCVSGTKPGTQGQWFQLLMQYLKRNPEIGWSYYPINGTNAFDETSDNSILNRSWTAPAYKPLLQALQSVQH